LRTKSSKNLEKEIQAKNILFEIKFFSNKKYEFDEKKIS